MNQTRVFLDSANLEQIDYAIRHFDIAGFTTNPTLMAHAGVKNYESFARTLLNFSKERPVCFEVIADDFETMFHQATKIASWGPNVYVKIPITNTQGQSSEKLIKRLVHEGVSVNVTAIFTKEQIARAVEILNPDVPSIVSIFAGRIADAGHDPVSVISNALEQCRSLSRCEVLWASPREVLNLIQAREAGCHIITMTFDLLQKVPLIGKNLEEFSLDTVKMFYNDAVRSGLQL